MILVITHKDDFTADYIITGLQKKNIEYFRFNTEDIFDHNQTSVEYSKHDCKIKVSNLDRIDSVLFRRTKIPVFENLDPQLSSFYQIQTRSFIDNLFSIIDAKWISDPQFVYRAENKLLQLKVAQRIGFDIPHTLVTTNNEEVAKFYEKLQGNIIIKPLSRNRIYQDNKVYSMYTADVEPQHIEGLANYFPVPTIYQEKIKKQYELRITVVGENVFVAKIDSQTDVESITDWRKGNLAFTEDTVPENIGDKCKKIVKELNLMYGAIDLALDESGNYIFFEINPVGQYVWLELQTGMPITDSLIELLRT